MKKLLFFVLLACFLLSGFGIANAFPLYPGSGTSAGTKFEDDDLEYWVDNDVGEAGGGKLSVGDYLYAPAEFVSVEDILVPVSGSSPYTLDQDNDELVAWSQLEITSIDANDNIFFGEIDNNPMISVYAGGTNLDLSLGNDPTQSEAQTAATDGTFLWSFSIDPNDPDTFWNFSPNSLFVSGGGDPLDPSQVSSTSQGTSVGAFNFQLNQVGGDDIFNPHQGAQSAGGDGLVDLIGSGDIKGGAGYTTAFATSDVDVTVNPIPEPTTLLLFGTGLLGLAAFGRKKFMGKK